MARCDNFWFGTCFSITMNAIIPKVVKNINLQVFSKISGKLIREVENLSFMNAGNLLH